MENLNKKTDTAGEKLSGIAMMALLALSFLTAFGGLKAALKIIDLQNPRGLINGQQATQFEKEFNSNYMLFNAAKTLWGRVEYVLFQDGRDGVLIGDDGWLFSTEEFIIPVDRRILIEQHLDFIAYAADQLSADNIELVIALIPAKARIHEGKLGAYKYPALNRSLYGGVREVLTALKINVPDLYTALNNLDHAFMRTDTHWSPEGAQAAAVLIARSVQNIDGFALDKTEFVSEPPATPSIHTGDLSRYIPGGASTMRDEGIITPTTLATNTDSAASLFGDTDIPVTLVGTSYSANPLWHFEGHLKNELQADVLNVADEGQGPFETMRAWLDSAAYKEAKPALVIWEVPERYIALPDIK